MKKNRTAQKWTAWTPIGWHSIWSETSATKKEEKQMPTVRASQSLIENEKWSEMAMWIEIDICGSWKIELGNHIRRLLCKHLFLATVANRLNSTDKRTNRVKKQKQNLCVFGVRRVMQKSLQHGFVCEIKWHGMVQRRTVVYIEDRMCPSSRLSLQIKEL